MASTIKVNTIQNTCGADIIKESSNTITIGASGDTVTLASGASQTGFGRTGTVDWQTSSIKTSTFTAESGKGYFCNTAGGSFEVDLPAGTAGAIVSIQDYNNTFDSNNLTVDPNGSEKINGGTAGGYITLSTEGEGITLVYVDSTVGWRSIQDNVFADPGAIPSFVAATGGTVTTVCTNYKVHTFTGPGTFCVSCAGNADGSNTIDYLVVAGGGGGGDGAGSSTNAGGGGGAGGYRESSGTASGSYTVSPLGAGVSALPVTATGYPVTIGAGGTTGASGSNSVFTGTTTITSAGGGNGGNGSSSPVAGSAGGSGGGANTNPGSGSAGNTPPVSPPQGNNGGSGGDSYSGGGGGATSVGEDAGAGASGGGNGATSSINGTPTARAAGGDGGGTSGPAGTPQTANTGNGAPRGGAPGNAGGTGGSGIVIIRYKFQ